MALFLSADNWASEKTRRKNFAQFLQISLGAHAVQMIPN